MWSSDSDEDIVEERVFRERINFEVQNEFCFNEKFRVNPATMEDLLIEIGPRLERPTNRNNALSAKHQLLMALHWVGNGGQMHGIGDMHGVSKSSISRSVHSVVHAVNEVKFPTVVNWPDNCAPVVEKFHAYGRMPYVVGAVDGTLINIDAPRANEEQFVDRHGNHSINCMVVCGPNREFYYVSANWPGSTHDSRVLRRSTLFQRMGQGWRPFPNAVILGDSGYPLLPWLIKAKLTNLNDPMVQRFNRAHKRTRSIVENAFGILKEKFPCLNHLRVDPVFAAEIFKFCTTLCNMTQNNQEEDNVGEMVEDLENIDDFIDVHEEEDLEEGVGEARRQQLINHFA